jgi:hypothetical protein
MHGRRHGEAGETLQGAPPERERANRLWIAANQAATPDTVDNPSTTMASSSPDGFGAGLRRMYGVRREGPRPREIRLLEQALKATNARTTVDAYDQDDAVLGELT